MCKLVLETVDRRDDKFLQKNGVQPTFLQTGVMLLQLLKHFPDFEDFVLVRTFALGDGVDLLFDDLRNMCGSFDIVSTPLDSFVSFLERLCCAVEVGLFTDGQKFSVQ